jgi:hypothetical protein
MPRNDGTPFVVFDLDGTILRVNSFPRWVLFLIVGRVSGLGPHRRALLSLRTVSLLLRRKAAGASHEEFLCRLQGLWRSACVRRDASSERFETKLLRWCGPIWRRRWSLWRPIGSMPTRNSRLS